MAHSRFLFQLAGTALVIGLSSLSFGQTTAIKKVNESFDSNIATIENKLPTLRDYVAQKQKELDDHRKWFNHFSTEYNNAQSRMKDCISGAGGNSSVIQTCHNQFDGWVSQSKTKRNDYGRWRQDAQAEIYRVNREITQLDLDLSRLKTKKENAVEAAQESVRNAEIKGRYVDTKINYLELRANFQDFKSQFQYLNDAFEKVESDLDPSMISAYMQLKVAKLLASDAFCKAQKSCGGEKPKSIDLNEIFPATKAENVKHVPTGKGIGN